MNRIPLSCLLVLVGCSTSSEPAAARKVSGQLSTRSMQALDNPAIVVSTGTGERQVVRVARTGEFQLLVPTRTPVRLDIATTLPSGALRQMSTIVWPSRTAVVEAGAPIDLGVVHKRGEDSKACDREGGGDEGPSGCMPPVSLKADLPYDAKLPLGATYRLTNSFIEKGALPAKILSVTMSGGGDWRLGELKADAVFTVTPADCQHAGNRSTGRDRIEVTWQNRDGSTETDHLDMRYCDGNAAPPSALPAVPAGTTVPCESVEVCDGSNGGEHECGHGDFEGVSSGGPVPSSGFCEGPGSGGPAAPGGTLPPAAPGGIGAACVTNADCAAATSCFQSKCASPIN